jgi:transposase
MWLLLEPLIPPERHGGRHRTVDIREVWKQLNAALRDAVREQEEREAEPSAAIMDSQAE